MRHRRYREPTLSTTTPGKAPPRSGGDSGGSLSEGTSMQKTIHIDPFMDGRIGGGLGDAKNITVGKDMDDIFARGL